MFGGGGKGMGGAAGRANMLRAVVGRAAVSKNPTATFQDTLSSSPSPATRRHNNSSSSNGYLYVFHSSSGSSSLGSHNSDSGVPITANSGSPSPWSDFSCPSCFDDFEWVPRHEEGNEQPHDFVLGTVPTAAEVQTAVSALQRVVGVSSPRDKFSYNADEEICYQLPRQGTSSMHRVHSVGSELEWMEPSMQLQDTRAFQPCVTSSVYEAFRLLQIEPTVQKMVVSLSSDEAVWNAVLNNEMVRELKESYAAAPKDCSSVSSDESFDESSESTNMVKWIFEITNQKITGLFDKITKLVNELFKLPPNDDETKTADPFDERLRISMALSVLVLLVVVVTRVQPA